MRRARSFLGAEEQARGIGVSPAGTMPLFERPFRRGMKASAGAAASKWSGPDFATVEAAILTLAAHGAPFTADDVWAVCPNVLVSKGLSSMLNTCARRGLIHNTGELRVSHRGGEHDHAQRLTVWKGGPRP